jgi:hypothetical protein
MKKMKNAFTINRLGNNPFPFSVKILRKEVIETYSYPIAIKDILDTLLPFIQNDIVVFDTDTNDYKELFDGNHTNYSLTEIANDLSISFKCIDKEIIKLNKANFIKLIHGIEHYNLHFFDIAPNSDDDEIIDWYINYLGKRDTGFNYLPTLKSSSIYVDSHDDCYFYLETTSIDPVLRIIQESLSTFTETIINKYCKLELVVELPQIDLVKLLNLRNGVFTIFPEKIIVDASVVIIPISFIKYEFGKQREYPIEANLEYDYAARKWTSELEN